MMQLFLKRKNKTSPTVIIGTPVLLWGGTEIQTLTLVKALVEMGCIVTVCCYHEYDTRMVEAMKKSGAKIDLLAIDRTVGYPAVFRALRTYFRTRKPDAVHIRYIAPGLLPILAARTARISRVFVTVGQLGSPYGLLPKLFIRISCFLSTVLICTSTEIEKSWFGKSSLYQPGKKPTKGHCTIHNGIDIDMVADKSASAECLKGFRQKYTIPPDKTILSVVGRLRHEKGQIIALQAMKQILVQKPDCLLLFAGDGPDYQNLKLKRDELGLEQHCLFLGLLNQDETFALYGVSDCIIIPSIYEGFGLTAVEAMAAGKPVVASNVGGLVDIIEDGITGYLVPVGRSGLFSTKILSILESKDLARRMGKNGSQRVHKMFSYEAYFEKILDLYSAYQ